MLTSFRRYPGTTLGVMAVAGAVKVGAILWETTFSAWPLLQVLILPALGGGLALGIGMGHDHLLSASGARRLGATGLLVLSAAAGWGLVGPPLPLAAWPTLLLTGAVLVGLPIGYAPPSIFKSLLNWGSSQQRVRSG
ncbi:MAG: hypothetical protein ABEL51_04670 [Salinibacter sp.]